LVRRIAAFGLHPDGSRQAPISDKDWPIVLSRAYDQRLTGLALAATEDGTISLTSQQVDDLLTRHRDAMLQALALERHLVTLSAAIENAGIEMVLLKGPALAHTVYPDPSWRPFADLDLLVRGRDFHRTCDVLAEHGFHRGLPEPRAGFDVRFGKAAELLGKDGLMIDLHRTLVVGPFGLWIGVEELFAGTVTVEVGDRIVRRLDDTNLFLHACVHASLGWWPALLMPVRDVAQVSSFAEIDWDLVADRCRRWRLAPVVKHALATTADMLGAEIPDGARSVLAIRSGRRERRALEAYVTDRRQRGSTTVSALWAIPGVRGKLAYVKALVFPSREFLSARQHRRPPSYLRRWAVPFRWLVGKR
jgi:hypothetical protein